MAVSWRVAFRTGVHSLVGMSLILALVACGGDSSPTSTPTPTPAPTPPPPVVVLSDQWRLPTCGRNCITIRREFFDTSSTGTIDATVNYTHEETMLAVWIASGACEYEQFVAGQCQFVATSMAGSKPRVVSATNQPPRRYTLYVGNGGPREESIAFQVVFTPQAAATANPVALQRQTGGMSGGEPTRFVPAGP